MNWLQVQSEDLLLALAASSTLDGIFPDLNLNFGPCRALPSFDHVCLRMLIWEEGPATAPRVSPVHALAFELALKQQFWTT
eukprot:scaffold30656_cov18-Tisochrysis_lutea.AAC.1